MTDIEPTNADYDAALRLTRKHVYGGNEPYAPAVPRFAAMLAEHRAEVQGTATRFVRGDIVCVHGKHYGVVVKLPTAAYPRYRVRVSTSGWRQYSELGALESELKGEPEGG